MHVKHIQEIKGSNGKTSYFFTGVTALPSTLKSMVCLGNGLSLNSNTPGMQGSNRLWAC